MGVVVVRVWWKGPQSPVGWLLVVFPRVRRVCRRIEGLAGVKNNERCVPRECWSEFPIYVITGPFNQELWIAVSFAPMLQQTVNNPGPAVKVLSRKILVGGRVLI